MTTVYVVTQGDYSDYGIERVFSTQLLAEEFVNGNPEMRIEPYEVDEKPEEISRPYWSCTVHLFPCKSADAWPVWERTTFKAGEMVPSHHSQYSHKVVSKLLRSEPLHFCYGPESRGSGNKYLNHDEYGRIVTTSFVSQEHANKLAVEAWQAWLRAGKPKDWKPDD